MQDPVSYTHLDVYKRQITMYVNGGLIPVLLLYKTLRLTNSFWVYVIPGMVSAFNVLVLRTYMQGLPEALEDAAKIDGAGYMTIFVKVISPLCKPVYATVALFVAVGQWNSWFDAMIYNRMKTEYKMCIRDRYLSRQDLI